jgi:hypothetical protein
LIFGIGALFFAFILYLVGVFDILQDSLGTLFFPVLCVIAIFVAVLVLFVIPRQYQSSVEMYQAMGNSQEAEPVGNCPPSRFCGKLMSALNGEQFSGNLF